MILRSIFRSRRLLRTLERIAVAQEQQAASLAILVDHFVPTPQPLPTDQELKTHTAATYAREEEQARIQEYIARCWTDTKRLPTDDEIVRWLEGEDVRL